MLSLPVLLWAVAGAAALLLSVCGGIVGFTSNSENNAKALLMLPLAMHPHSPPSGLSKVFMGLFAFGFLSFFGALVALLFISKWIPVVVAGVAMFIAKNVLSGWWVRNTDCRPMLPLFLSGAALAVLVVVTGVVALLR